MDDTEIHRCGVTRSRDATPQSRDHRHLALYRVSEVTATPHMILIHTATDQHRPRQHIGMHIVCHTHDLTTTPRMTTAVPYTVDVLPSFATSV